jgi:glycosyltransferase involved in cell wall biosynthesis
MAAHKPVVATDSAAMREYVMPDETGILTPVGDSAALAAALRRLGADSELRTALGQRGAESVRSTFNHDAMWARIAPLVRQLAASRRAD